MTLRLSHDSWRREAPKLVIGYKYYEDKTEVVDEGQGNPLKSFHLLKVGHKTDVDVGNSWCIVLMLIAGSIFCRWFGWQVTWHGRLMVLHSKRGFRVITDF